MNGPQTLNPNSEWTTAVFHLVPTHLTHPHVWHFAFCLGPSRSEFHLGTQLSQHARSKPLKPSVHILPDGVC